MSEQQEIHRSPVYNAHKAQEYVNVTQCIECKSTAMYEDQHPINPCGSCGGEVKQITSRRWVKAVYSGCWPWSRKLVAAGYWRKRDE
jgi:hypothetical protein